MVVVVLSRITQTQQQQQLQSHHHRRNPISETEMDPSFSQWIRPLVAVTVGSLIAFRAHRKKSLSTSGALAGFFVLSLHVFVGFR